MGIADVGDDTHGRLCGAGKTADLSEVGHAHFNDSCGVLLLQLHQRLWQPDLVVQVALCFQRAELGFQHAGDHFFCSGLSHASGDTDQNRMELFPIEPCDFQQRPSGVFHHQTGAAFDGLFRHGSHGSGSNCLRHKVVAVEPLPPAAPQTGSPAAGYGYLYSRR